jgi:hypothetical protein
VRRFFCDNISCSSRTFAEQPAELTEPRARRHSLVRRMLVRIAVALAGRAGARLAERLGMPTSRDSMLRLLRTLPDPSPDHGRPRSGLAGNHCSARVPLRMTRIR